MRGVGSRDYAEGRLAKCARVILFLSLVAATVLCGAQQVLASDLGVRYENRTLGVSGVTATVWSDEFAMTLGPRSGFQLVKLCNQAASNRHFMTGLRRQQGTGYPDYKLNLYYNLQIRRGTDPPTLIDWYICEYRPGTAFSVDPKIKRDINYTNIYELYFNGTSFGRYSWYTAASNTCGTWATAELYGASSGLFQWIKVYQNVPGQGYLWRVQYSSFYPNCEFMCSEPYPWNQKIYFDLTRPNYEWHCESVM